MSIQHPDNSGVVESGFTRIGLLLVVMVILAILTA